MKAFVTGGIILLSIVAMFTTGFQCSSSELTSAKLYIQRKEYTNAEAQLKKEVERNPKSEEGWLLLGQVRHELKDYKGMKDAFSQALIVNPNHKNKKDMQTLILSVWGRLFNQGVDEINKAQDPDGFNKAIESFAMAVYVLPESTLSLRNLGVAYYRKGDVEKAVEPLTQAMDKGNDVVACRVLGRLFADRGADLKLKFTETNREKLDLIKNLGNIREKMKAADVKFFLGQPSSVVTLPATKTKGKKSDSPKEEWKYDKYTLTLTVEDELVSSVKYSSPYKADIDSSLYFQSVAEYQKAVEVFKKGIAKFSDDPEISEGLMNSYIGADKHADARMLLEGRVKKYPDSKFDHYNMGVFLLKDMKYEEAIVQFKETIRIDSSFSAAIYNLAASYVNWGVAEQERIKTEGKEGDVSFKEKYKMAIPYLERVVTEKPNEFQMWELLGQVYANLGIPDKAKVAYDKADAIRQGKN